MLRLDEFLRQDIISGASPEPWKQAMGERIKGYSVHLIDVQLKKSDNICLVMFKTEASGKSSQYVSVNLVDFWKMYYSFKDKDENFILKDVVSMCITDGDIEVNCSCPHWVYGGYKYMATKLGYAFKDREDRFPKIKNPKLLGTVCKHIFVTLKYLPNNSFSISKLIDSHLN